MNILLWILQGLLAFLYLAGGGFKLAKPDELAKQLPTIPGAAWRLLGILEAVGALLLIVPAFVGGRPGLVALAAAVLAGETLLLALLYGVRSVKLVAANPFGWAAAMGLLAALVAYGRHVLLPLA